MRQTRVCPGCEWKFGRWQLLIAACLAALAVAACAPQPTATPVRPTETATSPATLLPEPTVTMPPLDTPEPTPSPAPTETNTPSPLPTARPRLYEDLGSREILAAILPNLPLTEEPDGFLVFGNADWKMWVNDRDEGRITQTDHSELAAIVANLVGARPPEEAARFGRSGVWLVILDRTPDTGELHVVQREELFDQLSPLAIDARLQRIVDIDHDGQDEMLIISSTIQASVIQTQAWLLRWERDGFVELWRSLEAEDNTAALNQEEYSAYEATVDFADEDNNGIDEIIVNGKLSRYPKDNQGRADLTAPASVLTAHQVYKWDGERFVLDIKSSTPLAPAP